MACMRYMPYVLFLFVCAVWSVSFLLMKKGAVAFSPTAIGAWRVIGGAGALGLIWLATGRKDGLERKDCIPLGFVTIVGCAWPYSIQPWLIQRHGSAFVAMTVSFVPLMTVAVSAVWLRMYPTPRQLFGVGGALVCMAILMLDGLRRQIPLRDLGLAMTVPLGYALANNAIRRHLHQVPPLLITMLTLACAGVVLWPLSRNVPPPSAASGPEYQAAVISVAFLGVVGTGLATFVFNQLIRDHGPLFAGMTTNLVPLGAVLWGWLDREPVSLLQVVAVAGVLAMVAVVQYGAAAPPLRPPSHTHDGP